MYISRKKNAIISVCGQSKFSTQKLIHMLISGVKIRIKEGCEVGYHHSSTTPGSCLSLRDVIFYTAYFSNPVMKMLGIIQRKEFFLF